MCSSTGVDRLCITSQWTFATKDLIQIWDKSMASIFLNLYFNHTQKKRSEFLVNLAEANRNDAISHLKIRPFVLWFWIWDFNFLQVSGKCRRFPVLTALARLKRQRRSQPSPSRGWYCSSPTCCWMGRKRLGPLMRSDYVIKWVTLDYPISYHPLLHLRSPFYTQFFAVLMFVVSYVDSKLFGVGSISYLCL